MHDVKVAEVSPILMLQLSHFWTLAKVMGTMRCIRDSYTSSEKEISLKLEKPERETRSQWQAVPHGDETPLFGVWSDSRGISCLQNWMGALQLKLKQTNCKILREIALKCRFFTSGGEETALSIL